MPNDSQLREAIRAEYDAISFSTTEKDNLIQSLDSPARSRKRMRGPIIAGSLAVAFAVGGGVVAAQGGFESVGDLASSLFPAPVANTEMLETIGHPVGAVDSSNGITISADAVIGDKRSVAVLYTISKDDGSVFDVDPSDLYFDYWNQDVKPRPDGMGGAAKFFDEDPTDNKVQLLQYFSVPESLEGGVITTKFKDLLLLNTKTQGPRELLVPGNWTLRFELAFPDTSRALSTGTAGEIEVTDLSVSAITTSMEFVTPDWEIEPEIEVVYTSGASQVFQGGNKYCTEEEDHSVCRLTSWLEDVIDPDTVAAVKVDGVEFTPLPG